MTSKTFIILVNYNNHCDTIKCLTSISESGYAKNVIVVDNNSTTPGVDDLKIQFPDTILIKNIENVGFGRANNIGIDWALENTDCEYIFILNNDTTINNSTIPTLESALHNHPETVMTTPRILLMENPNLLWYGGGDIDWLRGSGRAPGILGPADTPLAMEPRNVNFASGCAMLIKRSLLEKIGGFDHRFFMYEEDVEFCLRITRSGGKIRYEPSAWIKHKGHGSMSEMQENFVGGWHYRNPNLQFHIYHILRNRLLNMHIHAKGKQRWLFHIGFPLFFAAKAFQLILQGRIDIIGPAWNAWQSYRRAVKT